MNLITGSTGIVGIRIMYDLLKKGNPVKALRRASSNLDLVKKVFDFYESGDASFLFDKIEWVLGDVKDIESLEEALENCDHVYHCAAVVSFHPSDSREMYLVNQLGTENLVNIAIEKGVKKLCHISSIAAIGRTKIGEMITEKTDWTPSKYNSYYAVTKYGAEREVWRGTQEGLSAVILNPGIIFGAGATGKSSASLFSAVQRGLKFYTKGTGSVVDVRDVSQIAIRATQSDISEERYILVSENIKLKSLFEKIADKLGQPRAKIFANKFMLNMAWITVGVKDYFFKTKSSVTREAARAANSSFNYSSEKVIQDFDYKFLSCQESVDYFSEYYRR